MAISTLNFLNKNQFRSYPLKAGSSLTSIDGKIISDELFVGASITTTINRKNLFIKQVYINGAEIRVTIAAVLQNSNFETLGICYGTIESDFTVLKLTETAMFTSGTLIVGTLDSVISHSGVYTFDNTSANFEESVVFYYTPPPVKSLHCKGISLRGNVKFGVLSNLIKSRIEGSNKINFGVISSASVNSLADKSSVFNNCPTPIIRYIDGAIPFYQAADSVDAHNSPNYLPALQGNLFMVGVSPLSFKNQQNLSSSLGLVDIGGISTEAKSITNGSPITLNTLCSARNAVLPPVAPMYINNGLLDGSSPAADGISSYYTKSSYYPSNFYSVVDPEFTWWPQFFTYSSIAPATPITANIGATGLIGVVTLPAETVVKKYSIAVVFVNTGVATLDLTLVLTRKAQDGTTTTSKPEGFHNIIVNPNSSIIVRTVNDSNYPRHEITGSGYPIPMEIATGDTFYVYFNNVSGGVSTLQPYLYYR